MTVARSFRRRFDALPEIFAFTAEVWARESLARALLPPVDLVLEELFTNTVKYGHGQAAMAVEIAPIAGGVEVTLIDDDAAEAFDVTRAAPVDVTLPIDQRHPGGLGLHLIRQLVDCIEYHHSAADRRSRVTFRKTSTPPLQAEGTGRTGGANARD